MVKYDYIIKVMELYITKCPTIAEISSKLQNLSQTEKNEQLEGKLNDGEKEVYNTILRNKGDVEEELEKHLQYQKESVDKGHSPKGWDILIRRDKERLEEYDEQLFGYERRIFDGYKPRDPVPVDVDVSNFKEEHQSTDFGNNEIGGLERKQIESQEKISFTDEELGSLQNYYGDGSSEINSKLNDGKYWNHFSDEVREKLSPILNKQIKNISNAINKTEGMIQDTTVYHGGEFDVSKVVGDTVKFKGFTSASFQMNVAEDSPSSMFTDRGKFYVYKILLPKGSKGLCANDKSHGGSLTMVTGEQELLLDKGFEGSVVDIDYENHIVTVLKTN